MNKVSLLHSIFLPMFLFIILVHMENSRADWAINTTSHHWNDEDGCGNDDGCNEINPGLQYDWDINEHLDIWTGFAWNSEKKISVYGGPALEICESILCVGVVGGVATGYNRGATALDILGICGPFVEFVYFGFGARVIYLPGDLIADEEGALLFQLVFD